MLALEKSRTLSPALARLFGLGFAALLACNPEKPEGGGPTTSGDTDTETDTDIEPETDTGIAGLYWLGEFETNAGTFTSASLGFGAYGIVDDDWACRIVGDLTYEGDAPAGCPACEWAFDLSGVSGSAMDGPHCEGFVNTIFADGGIDTYFDWSWGFAASYTYYGSDGTAYPLDETIFINQDGTNWGLFAFNYGANFQMVTGDATALSIQAQASDGTSNIYYYYYR